MISTERLIDSSKNRFARELLRSAELDEAPDNTMAKVAFALGLGSTAIVTTITSGAAASTGLAASMGTAVAAAPAVSAVSALGMLKVMAVVSLTCGTLCYGGTKLALKVSERPTAAMTAVAARPASIPLATRNLPTARAVASFAPEAAINPPAPSAINDSDLATAALGQEQRQPDTHQEATASAPSVGRQFSNSNNAPKSLVEHAAQIPASPLPASRSAAPPTAVFPGEDGRSAPTATGALAENSQKDMAKPAADLEREVAQLDHARAALAAGQPGVALRELDLYRAQSPQGKLVAESVVLRVKALLATGQRAAAEREANPLIMAAPQSRHAQRLLELIGASSRAP